MFKYCIPVLSSTSTSIRFDETNRYQYFLRSVPSDKYQVQAIIHLLKKMRWHRIAVLHEDSNYGSDFNEELLNQLEMLPIAERICIDVNIEVPNSNKPDWNWNATLAKLEKANNRVILLLMDRPQTGEFFDAVAHRRFWLPEYIQFIGIDGWSNQQDFNAESIPWILNSITSEPSAPIFEEFRRYITGLTLQEAQLRTPPDFCKEIKNYSILSNNYAES